MTIGLCISLSLVLLAAILGSIGASNDNQIPELNLIKPEIGYHGLVKENERVVDITPRIQATGTKICGYRIVNKHHGEAPFDIALTEDGETARLTAKKQLNCEKRKNYKFDIAAVGCNGILSQNATVHISVIDVNEFAPLWLQPSYSVQVDEGRLYDVIVRVEAHDQDCSNKYGDICKYEIQPEQGPFVIDTDGKIRNTEALVWEKLHNYILSVVAYDCGMQHSAPVMVNIKVNRVCSHGWKGINERIDYVPGSGKRLLFPEASLELCSMPCQVDMIKAQVFLTISHIGKGCDRDTYSVDSQRKLCGASVDSVDLLPSPSQGLDWTHSLSVDEGRESDQIYEFDGRTNAVVIPTATLDHELRDTFTISTWMKHAKRHESNSHAKEHIICNSDDHKMNRPHYSLFVRNCRLILLIRRDVTQENLNTFRPAEWRWKLHQTCDNQWHHYAVSVQFPNVTLYVDGQRFRDTDKNPDIIDDWPLHPTTGINTTMVVGACWHGAENKMTHYFTGFLSGLSILRGQVEKPEVLACLHKCKESLENPSPLLLQPGMELLTNNELTEVSIEGENKTNIETLIQQIAYVNSREFPTPGRRTVKLVTTVQCSTGKLVKIPSKMSYVIVQQPDRLTIQLNGTAEAVHSEAQLVHGIKPFVDITVSVYFEADSEQEEILRDRKIDKCTITVIPELHSDFEYFTMPEHQMSRLGISHRQSADSVVITGADLAGNYEQVLHDIHYYNHHANSQISRTFRVVCSEMNDRFVSNEFEHTVTFLHTQAEVKHVPVVAHMMRNSYSAEAPKHMQHEDNAVVVINSGTHTVTIIVVVCIGFLVFMIVLAVIRIRAAQNRFKDCRDDDQEMAWDDSALNITVNPLEQMEADGCQITEKSRLRVVHQSDYSEDDDNSDCEDMDEDIDTDDDVMDEEDDEDAIDEDDVTNTHKKRRSKPTDEIKVTVAPNVISNENYEGKVAGVHRVVGARGRRKNDGLEWDDSMI